MGLILGKKIILKTKVFSSILGVVREHYNIYGTYSEVISSKLPLLLSCPFTRNTREAKYVCPYMFKIETLKNFKNILI